MISPKTFTSGYLEGIDFRIESGPIQKKHRLSLTINLFSKDNDIDGFIMGLVSGLTLMYMDAIR